MRQAACLFLFATLVAFSCAATSEIRTVTSEGLIVTSSDLPIALQFRISDVTNPKVTFSLASGSDLQNLFEVDKNGQYVLSLENNAKSQNESSTNTSGLLKAGLLPLLFVWPLFALFGKWNKSMLFVGCLAVLLSLGMAVDVNDTLQVDIAVPAGFQFKSLQIKALGGLVSTEDSSVFAETVEIDLCADKEGRSEVQLNRFSVGKQMNVCAASVSISGNVANKATVTLTSPFSEGFVSAQVTNPDFAGKFEAVSKDFQMQGNDVCSTSTNSSPFKGSCGPNSTSLRLEADHVRLAFSEVVVSTTTASPSPTQSVSSSRGSSKSSSASSSASKVASRSATSSLSKGASPSASTSTAASASPSSSKGRSAEPSSSNSQSKGASASASRSNGSSASTSGSNLASRSSEPSSSNSLSKGASASPSTSIKIAQSVSASQSKIVASAGQTASASSSKVVAGSASASSSKVVAGSASASPSKVVAGSASASSSKVVAGSASASTSKPVSRSASPSRGAPQPCAAGWTEPPAIDETPASAPVTSSWNNPGLTTLLNNASNWVVDSYSGKSALAQFDDRTISVTPNKWDGTNVYMYLKDGVLPTSIHLTDYTFQLTTWQLSTNTYNGKANVPTEHNVTLFAVNNLREDQLWSWINSIDAGICNKDSNNGCQVTHTEVFVTSIPFNRTNAVTGTSDYQVPKTDATQVVLKLKLGGQANRDGNTYYLSDISMVRSPRARTFPAQPLSGNAELVHTERPVKIVEAAPTDCPHLSNGLVHWHAASTWDNNVVPTGGDVTLPAGKRVLISSCSIDPNGVFGTIDVPETSELIFGDAAISLRVGNIRVAGHLWIGSPTCRIKSSITITLVDSAPDLGGNYGRKGITTTATGILDMHGKLFQSTWSRLAASVEPLDDRIIITDDVNWQVGQKVVVVTSIWKDHLDNQNEVRTIAAIQGRRIQFTEALIFPHYAGPEYQVEVALLSRRILVQGDEASEAKSFGGHMLARGPMARFSGVQAYRMGQTNTMARYPFHFHMMGESPNSFFQDCSVYHSYYRCFTVHGTNSTRVSRNTGFDVKGHCYYLEDGVEEHNTLEFNLAAYPQPITTVNFNADYSQQGVTITQSADLLIPADAAAGGFYLSNANNFFIGNTASGGFAGFTFINFPKPIGAHKSDPLFSYFVPQERPLGRFYSNTAHSSSYQWTRAACIYTGGEQKYVTVNQTDILSYNVGRKSRNTKDDAKKASIMVFEDTRVFMCHCGLNHWGDRIELVNFEAHDVTVGATMFGEAWLKHGLIEGRSANPLIGFPNQMAFQYYDTWVKTILDDVTIRNFQNGTVPANYKTNCGVTSLTHSDKFKPQGINAARNIKWVNVRADGRFGNILHDTGASRFYHVVDHDNSMLGHPRAGRNPVILGSSNNQYYWPNDTNSAVIKEWWKFDGLDCVEYPEYTLYACIKPNFQEVVNVQFDIDGYTAYYNGTTWPEKPAGLNIGTLSQFGFSGADRRSGILTQNPGTTGFSGDMGWYMYYDVGSPASMKIRSMQIPNVNGTKTYVLTAIKYPNAATFNISSYHSWKTALRVPITPAASFNDFYNNVNGTNYYTRSAGNNEKWLFMKLVDRHFDIPTGNPNVDGFYERDGIRLYDVMNFFWYNFEVSCVGCTSVLAPGSNSVMYPVSDSVPPKVSALKGT